MTALLQRWRTRLGRRHPSEDRLIEAALGQDGAPAARAAAQHHLRRCPPCLDRARDLRTFLDALADAAGASFDEACPPARLRAQRTRIAHRLARAAGTIERARVIAFPLRRAPERRAARGDRRTAAAAAAVGLVLGMAAGQLVHLHLYPAPARGAGAGAGAEPRAGTRADEAFETTGAIVLPPAPGGGLNRPAAPLTLSEFEQVMAEATFFDSLDAALISLPVTELESIDALTPHVRDLAATIR